MRYVEISGIDRPLSVIGLGTSTTAFTSDNYDRAADVLDAFLSAGGNCVDTARIYGFGKSEQVLGRCLEESGRRDELVLISKGCHPNVDPEDPFGKPWLPRVTPDAIHSDLSESLDRLRTDHIDIYLLHRDDEKVPSGPLLKALNEEQARGRIKVFGASNWSIERIVTANAFAAERGLNGFVVSSPGLSLARPTEMHYPGTLFADDEIRHWHQMSSFPLLAWSAQSAEFALGQTHSDAPEDARPYISEGNFERLRRAQELGEAKTFTGRHVALAYVLLQPFPVVALVGASSVNRFEDALGALDVELTPDEIDYLDLRDA